MKKIITLFMVLLTGAFCFAQSAEYTNAMKKAADYESQKRWAYALGSYYDAIISADDASVKQEAYEKWEELSQLILSGQPGKGKFNAFSIHNNWAALLLDAEKYGTEYGAYTFQFGPLELGNLDYATETATYNVTVNYPLSLRSINTIDVIARGFRVAYKSDWTDLPSPSEWPIESTQAVSGTNYKVNDVALYSSDNTTYNAFAAFQRHNLDDSYWSDKVYSSLYDLKLNIVDQNGKEVVAGKRYLADIKYDYWNDTFENTFQIAFTGVKPEVMDLIDEGSAKVNVVGAYLEYGLFNADDDKGGRSFIKKFPELTFDKTKLNFSNVYGATDTDYRFYECKDYKTLSKSIEYVDNFTDFVKINSNSVTPFQIAKIETPQKVWEEVMGYNPSSDKSPYKPVTNITYYDAAAFCNKLSVKNGLTPVFALNGVTDPDSWNYTPGSSVDYSNLTVNNSANGYRLPTKSEWQTAFGYNDYYYSGSNNADDVAWYDSNSGNAVHFVANLNPNEYGLFDMSGNVYEMVLQDKDDSKDYFYSYGGSYSNSYYECECNDYYYSDYTKPLNNIGFRVIISDKYIEEQKKAALSEAIVNSYSDFVHINGNGSVYAFNIAKIETPQKVWEEVMGEYNPSYSKAPYKPVNKVSYYDVAVFCNKLSIRDNLTPCYKVGTETDPDNWGYTPGNEDSISNLSVDLTADGYRLPTVNEWQLAFGSGYDYSGSDTLNEVGWYESNSNSEVNFVGQKKANEYGLYDMSGNLWEMTLATDSYYTYYYGGSYNSSSYYCNNNDSNYMYKSSTSQYVGFRIITSERYIEEQKIMKASEELVTNFLDFAEVPSGNGLYGFAMAKIETPQSVYQQVMEANPSNYKKAGNYPVTNVSWYDAIVFCNKYSEMLGLTPCYYVNGTTDTSKWNYVPHIGNSISTEVTINPDADGFRLPSIAEWNYAFNEGPKNSDFNYSGSNDQNAVSWNYDNSYNSEKGERTPHPVAYKMPNALGIYDMSGNVYELCDESYGYGRSYCDSDRYNSYYKSNRANDLGFRLIRSHRGELTPQIKAASKTLADKFTTFILVEGNDSIDTFAMSRIEVPQSLFSSLMDYNNSKVKDELNPVTNVTWIDAIVFCNKLSERDGLEPCYAVDGETDCSKWTVTKYNNSSYKSITGTISYNPQATGYRLPTKAEWNYAAKEGKYNSNYKYSGSDSADEVAWTSNNCTMNFHSKTPHWVATKKANKLGLYDMSGNVREWVWDGTGSSYRYYCGSSYNDNDSLTYSSYQNYNNNYDNIGFRVIRIIKQ